MNAAFQQILDRSRDGYAIFDGSGFLIYQNEMMNSILGDEVLILTASDLFSALELPPLDPADSDGRIEQIVHRGRSCTMLTRIMRSEEELGLSVQLTDISDQVRLRETSTAHTVGMLNEIRARISPVFNALSLHIDYPDAMSGDDAKEIFKLARSDLWQLERQCDYLRDMSLAASGLLAKHVRHSTFSLHSTVRRCLADLHNTAADRGMPFAPLINISDEWNICGDQARITWIISGLLLNTMQHGGDNPTVLVSARAEGPLLALTISDDGPGIPSEDIPRLFGYGYRRKTTVETGAAGSELYLIRQLMTKMGGHIEIESAGSAGTIVTLFFQRSPEALCPG